MDDQRQQQHALALDLKARAERVEHALTQAIDSQDATEKRALLSQALEDIVALEGMAESHPEIQLPPLPRIRQGMAGLALMLYQQGACDALSEDQQHAFLDAHAAPLTAVDGVGTVTARRLLLAGVTSVEALRALSREQLEAIPGITNATLARLQAGLSQ